MNNKEKNSDLQCHYIFTENLLVENVGEIMTIGINRPQKRNAVDHETAKELVRAFQHFENSKEAKVAVLHGTGMLLSMLLKPVVVTISY